MNQRQQPATAVDSSRPTWIEWVACGLAAVAIVIAPLCLGATGAGSRLTLEAVLAVMVLAWCLRGRPGVVSLLLPCGVLGIMAVQLLPLSATFAVTIAPISAGAWVVAKSETGVPGMRISMDPGATIVAGWRLFLGLAAVLAVASLGRRPATRRVLTIAAVVSGIVILALGAAFPTRSGNRTALGGLVSLAGPITDWLDPRLAPVQTSGCSHGERIDLGIARYTNASGTPGDGSGSFISSNQFAAAVALTWPFVMAAWLAIMRRRCPGFVRHGVALAMLGGAAFVTAILAGSRAGTAAVLFAGLVQWMLSVEQREVRWLARAIVALAAILLVGFAAILYSGAAAPVGFLPESLAKPLLAAAGDARGQASRLGVRMFIASPVAGIGLGCYEAVIARYLPGKVIFHYAHNDYAQYVAETGLLGLIYAATVAGVVAWRWRRGRGGPAADFGPLDAAPWAALAGIAVHSGFDWNLHLPSNAFLAAVACGLSLWRVLAVGEAPGQTSRLLTGLRLAFAAVVLVACGILLRDALSERAQRGLREAIIADRLQRQKPTTPPPGAELAAAIAAGERAAAWDPRNSRLALLLGQATLHAAAGTDGEGERAILLGAADAWFRRAHVNRALCTGRPE